MKYTKPRIVPFEHGDDVYWLNYSARAAQKINALAKDVDYANITDFLNEKDQEKMMDNTFAAAEILMKQGFLLKDFEGEDAPLLSARAMELSFSPSDFNRLHDAVAVAIAEGSRQDVAAAPPKKEKAVETV